MAVFSKKLCQEKLNTWLEAEEAIATGQRYQIGTRMLTRADLKQVREEMEYWAARLAEAEAEEKQGGRNRVFRFVPRDL
ncbi:MAG: DUF6148 family protein [Muribaculaceae bacterium]|nr:DUF6148 family protein [Muribaculaceae bacterium]MCM1439346.1 DUF6148 family protein [Roseburia sp.]